MKYPLASSSSRKTKGSGLTQRAKKQIVRRRHACTYCPKLCTRPSELAEHIANHRGDKRHACVCDYSTAYRSNLNRHRSSCKVLKAKNEHSLPPDASSNGESSPEPSKGSPEAFGAPSSPHAPSPSLSLGSHDIASFDGFQDYHSPTIGISLANTIRRSVGALLPIVRTRSSLPHNSAPSTSLTTARSLHSPFLKSRSQCIPPNPVTPWMLTSGSCESSGLTRQMLPPRASYNTIPF
ncbi:hypothetical protein BS47DRAFT_1020582 [Hydnum rufescens UP504]|uniref:C2H2-type domain-containing protein n=1 Tax=Hydnum rufescens UP504 TaxID=1448309 RepID=A0A9P6AW31_9AGAM|nr:hypothetical protein BS47DRAFT_1020582 [Hydnum rufescens UP504]